MRAVKMRVAVADGRGNAFQSGQVVHVDDALADLWEGLGYVEVLPEEADDNGAESGGDGSGETIALPAFTVELEDGTTLTAAVLSVPLSAELLDQLAEIATDEADRTVSLTVVVDAEGTVTVDETPVLAGDADEAPAEPTPADPVKPRGNAGREEWATYATAKGATPEDLVDSEGAPLSRNEIRERWGV